MPHISIGFDAVALLSSTGERHQRERTVVLQQVLFVEVRVGTFMQLMIGCTGPCTSMPTSNLSHNPNTAVE